MPELESLGWNDRLSTLYEPYAGNDVVPGRVSIQHRGAYDVLTELGELRCEVPRRLVHEAATNADLPVVGDWVVVAPGADAGSAVGTITAVLPRFTKFSRKTAWQATEEQVLAANIDVAFLVASMNEDLSLRRLERYLILAWESGARPVIVLTKADLHPAPEAAVAEVETISGGVPVYAISSLTGDGLDPVIAFLQPGATAVLLGSSGVGKSTLVNALVGSERQATGAVREDDSRGRHTTTHRELIPLPGGGVLVDTPGMRAVSLWDGDSGGLEQTFSDVQELAGQCKFADCRHEQEPGCAVIAAVTAGTLPADRLESYNKLLREMRFQEIKQDKRARSDERKRWRTLNKAMRNSSRPRGE